MRDLQERLRAVAERVFPAGTRLVSPPGEGDYVLLASWKLGTDPTRPNKRSKTVHLAVSQEAMEDYRDGPAGQREYADHRFEGLLRRQLAGFEASHDTPRGTEPPIERWTVGTVELNG